MIEYLKCSYCVENILRKLFLKCISYIGFEYLCWFLEGSVYDGGMFWIKLILN